MPASAERVLTPEALSFVASLHHRFESTRRELLQRRDARQLELRAGQLPRFLKETANVRANEWRVANTPRDLQDRRVEITGPVDRKMMINAFNSGAKVFMADFEDALSPTWENVIEGQANLQDAVRRTLSFTSPEGKQYKLKEKIATLIVRPRGWHLTENTVRSAAIRYPRASSILDCTSSTTRTRSWSVAVVRISTCPRWRAISRRGSGTMYSSPHRMS
jgi:malate synthase